MFLDCFNQFTHFILFWQVLEGLGMPGIYLLHFDASLQQGLPMYLPNVAVVSWPFTLNNSRLCWSIGKEFKRKPSCNQAWKSSLGSPVATLYHWRVLHNGMFVGLWWFLIPPWTSSIYEPLTPVMELCSPTYRFAGEFIPLQSKEDQRSTLLCACYGQSCISLTLWRYRNPGSSIGLFRCLQLWSWHVDQPHDIRLL